jgi:hypothetical protein
MPLLPHLLALALLTAGCRDALAPSEAAPAARPVPISAEYRQWWTELQTCVDITAPLRVAFYVVPEGNELIDPATGREAEGLWIGHRGGPGTGDILVRARSRHRVGLVKHEMLHALLYEGGHDDPAWRLGERCGFDGRG